MISKKDILDLDFDTINDYFDYIVESEINGQRGQVLDLIEDMSKVQKKECTQFLTHYSIFALGEEAQEVMDLIIKSF